MKAISYLFFLSFISAFALPAYSAATSGTINSLTIMPTDYPDRVQIHMAGTVSGAAASCYGGAVQNMYMLDTSTNSGKQIFAGLLAARHAGSTVKVTGTGYCSSIQNVEDVESAVIK